MSNRFLLPCACGQAVTIEVSQAGQSVTCGCGKKLPVPSLRAIRQLAPVADAPLSKRPAASNSWNPVKGAIFAAGSLLFLGGLIATSYYYLQHREITQDLASTAKPMQKDLEMSLDVIGKLTADELYESWQMIKQHGLGEGTSQLILGQREAEKAYANFLTGGVVMASGLLLTLLAFFLPNSKK